MRTHGWAGDVPATDEHAVERILAATRQVIDEKGAATRLSDVARHLGVTRQTIYRYFGSTEELLTATALEATTGLLERVSAQFAGITEPDDAVVTGLAAVLSELRQDRYVSLVMRSGAAAIGDITADAGRHFAFAVVQRMDVDWPGRGFDDADLDFVVEIVLRTLQSMIIDAENETRGHAEIREFLDRWAGSAIRAVEVRAAHG